MTNQNDMAMIARARLEVDALAARVDASSHDSTQLAEEHAPRQSGVNLELPGYQMVREIHRGGQGIVYLAIQKTTRRRVAVKVVREGPLASPQERERLSREVRILGQLQHPGIVAIHDSGQSAGHMYFVMDYIAGRSLARYIDVNRLPAVALPPPSLGAALFPSLSRIRNWFGAKSMPVTQADRAALHVTLHLFARICDAVYAAHLRGIVHRDLKPGNIIIDVQGEPHVLDFGLARTVLGEVTDDSRPQFMTMTGQFTGSVPWASPEQAEAIPSKIDVRTDVYSLGVILFQMLTGTFPYRVTGNLHDALNNIMHAEPMAPSKLRPRVGDEVDSIVLKCLAKQPDDRYQSAGDLSRDVGRLLRGEPIEAKRASMAYLLRKVMRRNAVRVAWVATIVFCVTATSYTIIMYRALRVAESRVKDPGHGAAGEQSAADSASAAEGLEHLAWFMQLRQAGRVTEMNFVYAQSAKSAPGSPECAVMHALLDSLAPPEKALAGIATPHAALANMVVGDSFAAAGRSIEAAQAWRTALATARSPALRRSLQARLSSMPASAAPSTEKSP